MTTNDCLAKDPMSCPYHGKVMEVNRLVKEIETNFSPHLLNKFLELKNEIEEYKKMGEDEFLFSPVNKVSHKQGTDLFVKNLAEKLYPSLLKRTMEYHLSKYTQKVIKNIAAEQVLNLSLNDLGYKTKWDEGSHAPGPDIYLLDHKSPLLYDNGYSISVKSGEVSTSGSLKISGSRSTKHSTIEDKINFLNDTKPDMYFFFSQKQGFKKDRVENTVTYQAMAIGQETFTLGTKDDWEQVGNDWVLKNPTGPLLSAHISSKMSDQLWMTFDTNSPYFKGSFMPLRVRSEA